MCANFAAKFATPLRSLRIDPKSLLINIFQITPSTSIFWGLAETPFYPGPPCVEAGTYPGALTMSPHLGYLCPEVLNVPRRTAIRWHIGNFPKDVLGCCVVGTAVGTNQVENSRSAFDALMTKLSGAEHSRGVSRSHLDCGQCGDAGRPVCSRISETRSAYA
jgi:uncharacterized protein DUF5675